MLRRLIAVGDIHGCLDQLKNVLGKVGPSCNDTFIFLGDYINRGPDSRKVLEFLIGFDTAFSCIFLMGNHEHMLKQYLETGNQSFIFNGGEKTLAQYSENGVITFPQEHMLFLGRLLPFYETESHIFVHAGLKPGICVTQQDIHDLTWIREEFLSSDYDWGKTIVFGHTRTRLPVILKKRIGLDTGAGYPAEDGYGKVSCCDVTTSTFWSS